MRLDEIEEDIKVKKIFRVGTGTETQDFED